MCKGEPWIVEMGGLNNGYFVRKIFKIADDVEATRKQFANKDIYCTPYAYDGQNQKIALKIADFYLDFDKKLENNDDFNVVREDALKALMYLHAIFQVPKETVRIYFSGNKGLHLIVPREVMNIEPHVNLNRIFKSIAEEIFNYVPSDTLDVRIYDDKRLFRLVNSINAKSGKYKIPLSYIELKWASYEEIKAMADKPRFVEFARPVVKAKAVSFYKKYVNDWEQKIAKAKERTEMDPSKFKKLTILPPCINNILNENVPDGQRNNTAIALANFLQQQEYAQEEIESMMFDWGKSRCDPPMTEEELTTVIGSAMKHQYKFGCSSLKSLSICDKGNCPFFK